MLYEILTFKTSHYRNLFVAALYAVIFAAHTSPASKTEVYCKEILSWQKPVYLFDSNYNNNLIAMGARLVTMDNSSGWVKFFAS